MSLTEKQRLFVRAYLIDGNGKKAAIAAGYSPNGAEVAASRLLSQVKVQEALAAARLQLVAVSGVTPEWVLSQLQQMATLDIREVVTWQSEATEMGEDTETGEPILNIVNRVRLVDSDQLTAAAAAAITEVSQGKSGLKVKKVNRLEALLAIARILGMFPGQAKAPPKTAQPPAGATPPAPDQPETDAGGWGQLLN
ncbi:terminase small subunit [Pseudoroseomonas ludipueritiae]|uniref:Terminase small subunit n=1 Tax=Pseudoroseomonas ludipueritiae TaxID=198093 RepID=A0ABR7RA27_9PROT|nr:terminase small subunit [Pseudoroseomonas ludipueritiae]MBC9178559.1 terminase small subunit [Pseudoroseomonas ludipueritiae]MCG7363203.1 terminase small subunit [Roseomonas sp. ACRSG]